MAQVVECLASKCEALSSISSTTKHTNKPTLPTNPPKKIPDERMSKNVYTYNEILALKGKNTCFKNLKDIMLDKTSQPQNDKYHMIPPI
jgi:hypothetical protein